MKENLNLLDTWTSVQRAETLLVRTAVQRNPALMSQLFAGVELDRAAHLDISTRLNNHLEALGRSEPESREG